MLKMDKLRDIPFVVNIPIEKEQEFNTKVDLEMVYEKQRENKIETSFNNLSSRFRKVADYLWRHINKEVSYKQISEDLEIPEATARQYIADLNFYKGFPITMIPVPKKAGYIQSVLDNEEDYEKWDRKKMKTITSMSAVKNKAEKITSSKRRIRTKIKQKIKK